MTFNELKEEVIALGFDDSLEDEMVLVSAVNRALRTIYSERSITKELHLFSSGDLPHYKTKEIRHIGKETVTLPLAGRAFSMRVFGQGVFTVRGKGGEYNIKFDGMGELIRYLCASENEIVFGGDYAYTIADFTVYKDLYSPLAEDIPDGSGRRVFDIKKLAPDFLAFVENPRDYSGKCIPNCTLFDGKLEIDSSYRGEIIVTYRRLPLAATGTLPSENIDVPEELSHLLPLLVASYVWLDDDEQKAKYYRTLYHEMLEGQKRDSYSKIDTEYRNINGWA